jgi:hypothetical protein
MSAPSRAELQRALLEIRQAAERLKSYEPDLVDRLETAVRTHIAVVGEAQGLTADARSQCERIAMQGRDVLERIERARRYPTQIMARADMLDRTGALAKMVRDMLARLGPAAH